jgi:hypothetical protein
MQLMAGRMKNVLKHVSVTMRQTCFDTFLLSGGAYFAAAS